MPNPVNNPGPGKFIKLRGSKSGLRGGGGKLKVNEGVRKSIRGVSGGSPHTICQILANLYSKNCQYMYKNKVMEIFLCGQVVLKLYTQNTEFGYRRLAPVSVQIRENIMWNFK